MLETRTAPFGVVNFNQNPSSSNKDPNPIGLERKLRKVRSTEGERIIRTYDTFMVKAGLEPGPKLGLL